MMELPKRRPNRLSSYDYDREGAYFITICTQKRNCLLSRIVGDDALGVPENRLTDMGRIVEKYILSGNRMDRVQVEKYVIMPNHVHILITVDMKIIDGTPRASSPTTAVIPRFVASLKRLTNMEIGENVFQRSYHDHIIRGEQDFSKIWEYIDNNPKQWELDCFYVKEEENVSFHRQ